MADTSVPGWATGLASDVMPFPPSGSNGDVATKDSTSPNGVKWVTPSGGGAGTVDGGTP